MRISLTEMSLSLNPSRFVSSDKPIITRNLLPLLLAMLSLLVWPSVSMANGIPVQVFLDHVPLKTTWEPADGARGVAVVSSNDEQVRVMAQNLPIPPAGASYYAWLEQVNGGFLPVGSLLYQNDGTASLDQSMPELPYSENFAWVVISLENPESVGSKPSAEIALAGRLPNAEALPLSGNEAPQLLPVTGAEGGSSTMQLPSALLIVLFSIIGLLGVLRLYGQHNPRAKATVSTDDATATVREYEKRL